MISKRQLPELRIFAQAEKRYRLRTDANFGSLVVPNGNADAPCHRWFRYKEAFSSELLTRVLKDFYPHHSATNPIQLLDPFCGVGTGLLSGQLLDGAVSAVGIECNPFSAFVARTKLSWNAIDAQKMRQLAANVLASTRTRSVGLPRLSSIASGRCISVHMARHIVLVRDAIRELPASCERDALLLGLASTIEPVSRVRRDGRALRIVEKPRVQFRRLLSEKWAAIASDIETLRQDCRTPGAAEVRIGDGRMPSSVGVEKGSIDLILTSPPYPNNIDYNEVYKLELWFLEYAKDSIEFLELRRSTFRSHPTCSELSDSISEKELTKIIEAGPLADLMSMVIKRVNSIENVDRRGRSKVLLGYIYDTWKSLQAHFHSLRSGGRAIYVVGNSLHGGAQRPYLVPTDLIFARLAEMVGFKVEDLIIARGLQRRLSGNHFLRDSVLVFRKS